MPPSAGQIKKIHALKNALSMDEALYRSSLKEYGVKSSTKLSIAKADELLQDWEAKAIAMGTWESRKPARKAKATALNDDPQVRKIRELWIKLTQAGKVRNASEAAMNAYVERMTGIARVEWLGVPEASKVIEALKKWLVR